MARRTPMSQEQRDAYKLKRQQNKEAKLQQVVEPVEVSDKVEEPKKSLFERFTGSVGVVPPKKARRTKKVDPSIITKVCPLVLSTFAVSYIGQKVKDPYKPCCPSQEEVVNMVSPYFNILSRYVEITGHLSENTLDLISAVLASVIYSTRAYVTYVAIKENNRDRSSNDVPARQDVPRRELPDTRADSFTIDRDLEDIVIQEYNLANVTPNSLAGNPELTRYEAEKMDGLFKRDSAGRRRLGLL